MNNKKTIDHVTPGKFQESKFEKIHSVIFESASVGSKIVAGSDDYNDCNLMGPLIPEKFKKLILTTIKFEKIITWLRIITTAKKVDFIFIF